MTVNPIKILIAIVIWAVLTSAAFAVYVWQWVNTERHVFPENYVYVVNKGSSLHAVAKDLDAQGVLQWPRVWVSFARLYGLTGIKAGEYAFAQSESPRSILQKLNDGVVVKYQVTFVEGLTFLEILDVVHGKSNIEATITHENALTAMQALGLEIDHVEGWFYPDTYQYVAGDSDVALLKRAYDKMTFSLAEEWLGREKGLPYKNAYEALIMASIVEKETGAAHERAEIAGVFVRRLQKGMRLQTDPTVIYGMGKRYQGNIRRKDLKEPTPYNTYVIKGLPPTPIAMPGRDAIHAALHPKPGRSLYFVAKGDGTHYFSESLQEHNEAVRKFQKVRRSNYRSSPAPVE